MRASGWPQNLYMQIHRIPELLATVPVLKPVTKSDTILGMSRSSYEARIHKCQRQGVSMLKLNANVYNYGCLFS